MGKETKANEPEISFSYLPSPDKHEEKYLGSDFSMPNISDSEDTLLWGVL